MPNHVTNRITVTGPVSRVSQFKHLQIDAPTLEQKDGFDFNRVIERPEILDRTAPFFSFGPNGRPLLVPWGIDGTFLKKEDLEEADDEELAELEEIFGYKITPDLDEKIKNTPFSLMDVVAPDWYSWSVKNWGTKWNSYNFKPVVDQACYEFTFDTAWNTPEPILTALANKYPDLKFHINWFDEGACHAGQGFIDPGMAGLGSLVKNPEDPMMEWNAYQTMPMFFVNTEVEHLEPWGPIDPVPYAESEGIRTIDRLVTNFTCTDVGEAIDRSGWYPVKATMWSDDLALSDDELYAVREVHAKMLSFLIDVLD